MNDSYPVSVQDMNPVVKVQTEDDSTYAVGTDVTVYSVTLEQEEPISMTMDVGIQLVNSNPYEGEYTVIPKAHDDTVLPTRNKTMVRDVTVTQVPYYETHSETGTTIYIASEA